MVVTARPSGARLTADATGGAEVRQVDRPDRPGCPDYAVKDVEQLVSWLARQPRVLLDHPGDPRAGIAGASCGGAIALLAAAYDHRIDAIVPQITWGNLVAALFPNAAGGGRKTEHSKSNGLASCSPRDRSASGMLLGQRKQRRVGRRRA